MLRGFTLLELIIVIGFAALLFAVVGLFQVAPQLQSLELERARELIRSELVRARTDATAGSENQSWGVAFSASAITRFAGANFSARDPQFDVMTNFSAPVQISGTPEIVFTGPRGEPAATASITATDGRRSYTININAAGTITVQ